MAATGVRGLFFCVPGLEGFVLEEVFEPGVRQAGQILQHLFRILLPHQQRKADGGGELAVSAKRAAFTLVSAIQEEVHRFAIGYHRQKRGKRTLTTSLLDIDGVGKVRAQALLKHFGSLTAVKNAKVEQLLTVKGMTRPVAEAIRQHFENE